MKREISKIMIEKILKPKKPMITPILGEKTIRKVPPNQSHNPILKPNSKSAFTTPRASNSIKSSEVTSLFKSGMGIEPPS